MTNEWLPNPGTGVSPVREGETLTKVLLRSGNEHFAENHWSNWSWSEAGQYTVTHYQVSPPRKAEPATMSADEVLIRAREAAIEVYKWTAAATRHGGNDRSAVIQTILAYERARAKPLAEVAPHTAEDPDDRAAYKMCKEEGALFAWDERHKSPMYCAILKAIKRGRELERGDHLKGTSNE